MIECGACVNGYCNDPWCIKNGCIAEDVDREAAEYYVFIDDPVKPRAVKFRHGIRVPKKPRVT